MALRFVKANTKQGVGSEYHAFVKGNRYGVFMLEDGWHVELDPAGTSSYVNIGTAERFAQAKMLVAKDAASRYGLRDARGRRAATKRRRRYSSRRRSY